MLIGVLAGMIVGFGMSFAVEFLDRTVKSEKFVRDELGLTILGTIPQLSAKELQDNTRRASGHMVSSNSAHHHSGNSKHRRSRSRV